LETQYTTIKNASSQASVFFDVWYSQGYTNGVSLKYCKSMGIPLEVWTIDNVANFDSIDPYVTGVSSNWIVAGKYLSENKTYTITWQDENGNNLETETANYGDVITGPTQTKDGYIHRGWTTTETVTTDTLGSITITNRYSKKVTVKSDMVLKPEFYTATSVWDGTYPTVKSEVDAPIYQFGGTGSASDPFLISSAQDLAALSALSFGIDYGDYIGLDGETHDYYYNVIADINMSCGGWIPICYQNETGWINVSSGDWDTFRGWFKGADADNNDNVHTITFGEESAIFRFGLFFGIESATVKNINLTGNVIAGNYTAGVAVASKGWTTLENITSNVNYTIVKSNDPIAYSGGMLGHVIQNATEGTTLKNCKYTGTIVVENTYTGGKVGGLVGSGYNGLTLTNCPNTADSTGNIYYGENGVQVGDKINVSDYGVYPTWVGTLVGDYNDLKVTVTWGVDSAKPTTTEFGYGAKPVYTGTTPTKTSNKEGEKYVFAGWSTTDGQIDLAYGDIYSAVTDDVTLYPVFSTMVKVNVTVNDNNWGSVTIKEGDTIINENSFWVYKDSIFTDKSDSVTRIIEGSQYKDQQYDTITFTLTRNTIDKVGYTTTFVNWQYATAQITQLRNIYANFNRTANTYTIKFNATSGSGEMADMSFTYDQTQNLTANTFTKSGWVFVGWATTQDGAVEYTDNQEVLNLTATNGDEITLYAQWNCGITILVNNDTWGYVDVIYPNVEENSTIIIDGNTLKVGDVIITTAIPYDLAEFRGWSTQSSGKKMTDLGVVTGGTTYYALFYAKTSVWDGTYPENVMSGDGVEPNYYEGNGTYGSPYLIYDANDLATMSRLSMGKNYGQSQSGQDIYFKLMANMDLSIGGWVPICDNDTDQGGWQVGSNESVSSGNWHCFRGYFNGNNKTIIYGEKNSNLCFALFIGLESAKVYDLNFAGSIVGHHYSSCVAVISKGYVEINNVTSSVDFTIQQSSDKQARTGSMICQTVQNASGDTDLINCRNTGNITIDESYSVVGGFVGFGYNGLELYGCTSTGVIKDNNGTVLNDVGNEEKNYGVYSKWVGNLIGNYFHLKVEITFVVDGQDNVVYDEGYGNLPNYKNATDPSSNKVVVPIKTTAGGIKYVFAGWSYDNDGTVDTLQPLVEADTVYAVFSTMRQVTFNVVEEGWGNITINDGNANIDGTSVWVYLNSTFETAGNVLTITGSALNNQVLETITYSVTAIQATKTDEFTYAFYSWSENSGTITDTKTIVITFTKTTNSYIITWVVSTNGGQWSDATTTDKTTSVKFGDVPKAPEIPTKPNDGNTKYTFVRWDPTIASVTGNATYVAVFATKSAVSASLSVKETVGINFYIDVLAITSNDMGSYVKLTYNHNHTSYTENIYTDTIKISDLTKEKDGTYKFSIKYASGQIADGIVL
ncbi:MAG: InlB B-repeat-containing protein, partial [Clostridia bacterium]|nr:InlB B-repeat-containing protein [Clostridia bacterium]